MTADEFERAYAERSGVTVEWLRRYRTVLPCLCGASMCEGWQSISHELAADPFIRWQAGIGPMPKKEAIHGKVR